MTLLATTFLTSSLLVRALPVPFPGSSLYAPNDGLPHPGVVLLHGSEGGTRSSFRAEAQLLAAQGYVALAFCYAGCPEGGERDLYLPRFDLASIPLERTQEALAWLISSELVGGGKVALVGYSRGAEQALILASLLAKESAPAQPAAVAVHAASDVVVPAFNWHWRNELCHDELGTWHEICGIPPPKTPADHPPAWTWRGSTTAVAPGSRIEIERYAGPVFLSHGGRDQIWGIGRTRHIEERLIAAGRAPRVKYFPEEGHHFRLPAEDERKKFLLEFLGMALAPDLRMLVPLDRSERKGIPR